MTQERVVAAWSGWGVLAVVIVVFPLSIALLLILGFENGKMESELCLAGAIACFVLWIFLLCGFFTLQPNMSAVLLLFGKYVGTCKQEGFRWANPLLIKKKISLRHLASKYPYGTMEQEDALSLRGSIDEVSRDLQAELDERLAKAGVVIDEARLSHLAYAQEIAEAMLRRQQAEAIISARRRIVDGAVGMVEMALQKLEEHKTIKLDEERKATMVSNLLVVLCGEQSVSPVVNTGTLYN